MSLRVDQGSVHLALGVCHRLNVACRDLDALMSHYAQDVVFKSPRVAASHAATGVGSPTGILQGADSLRTYFAKALETVQGLQLTLTQARLHTCAA